MKTNEGSQVTGCQGGGRGGESALGREARKETKTEREEEVERNEEFGGTSRKCTSEETRKQEGSESKSRREGRERRDGDSTREERNQMSSSEGKGRRSDGGRKDERERGISGGVREEHIIPGALCLSSPLMSLIKANSNISALPWSAISKATLCYTAS